jgi:hypothetical protein
MCIRESKVIVLPKLFPLLRGGADVREWHNIEFKLIGS